MINHPYIIHEMVHVHIHKKFGFKTWRIVKEGDELVCIMTLHDNIFLPKYFPKIFLWQIPHLIHDTFLRFFILDILNITIYIKEFILLNIKIIKRILKGSE